MHRCRNTTLPQKRQDKHCLLTNRASQNCTILRSIRYKKKVAACQEPRSTHIPHCNFTLGFEPTTPASLISANGWFKVRHKCCVCVYESVFLHLNQSSSHYCSGPLYHPIILTLPFSLRLHLPPTPFKGKEGWTREKCGYC